jgi:3'(2'), 5'-bisphosphate nucleotidase
MPEYNDLLTTALIAAVTAGDEILRVYNGPFEVQLKNDQSPLTLADQNAHHKITEILSKTSLPVLSEEGRDISYNERKNWNRFWMVDPLDGTKEFVKKNGEFTVNIALIENNVSVMGAIYVPATDILYFGATWIPGKILYNASQYVKTGMNQDDLAHLVTLCVNLPLQQPQRNYTIVASRSHLTAETENFIDGVKAKHSLIDFVSSGSSLKICLVAEGTADIYPRLAPTMEWDTAAGQAIAESSGCRMYDFHTGVTVTYNKENLLNPHFVVERV